jgi:hypothetical protein
MGFQSARMRMHRKGTCMHARSWMHDDHEAAQPRMKEKSKLNLF